MNDILIGGLISIGTIAVTKIADYFLKSKELENQQKINTENNRFLLSKTFFERKIEIAEKAVVYFNSLGSIFGVLSNLYEMETKDQNEVDENIIEFYANSLTDTFEHLSKPENEITNAISLYFDIDIQKFAKTSTLNTYNNSLSKLGIVNEKYTIAFEKYSNSKGTENIKEILNNYLDAQTEYINAFKEVSKNYENAQNDIFELVKMIRKEMKMIE